MAKVVLRSKVGLWRIIDGRTNKPIRTTYNKAIDEGGCRTELDAYRLLKEYRESTKLKRAKA